MGLAVRRGLKAVRKHPCPGNGKFKALWKECAWGAGHPQRPVSLAQSEWRRVELGARLQSTHSTGRTLLWASWGAVFRKQRARAS